MYQKTIVTQTANKNPLQSPLPDPYMNASNGPITHSSQQLHIYHLHTMAELTDTTKITTPTKQTFSQAPIKCSSGLSAEKMDGCSY